MNILTFLKSKAFIKNLGFILLAIIVSVFLVFKFLSWYTNHGEYITLNDLTGLSLVQTIEILEDKNLTYEVVDTNTYNPDIPNHSIVRQDPLPLDKVKEGRTVYLFISTNKAPSVEIPFLKGKYSQEAGMMKLRNAKFKIGEITFKPSDTEGDILDLLYKGKEVKAGDRAPEGATIDLVVGGGLTGGKIQIPCLIGLTLSEAEFKLGVNDLNVGHIDYGSVALKDTSSAVIYQQMPSETSDFIKIGEPIDIYLKQELPYGVNKCENDSF